MNWSSEPMNADELVLEVAGRWDVKPTDVFGGRRSRRIVAARHEVCRRLRERGWSLKEIGRYVRRHHTTVLYALRNNDQT